LDVLFHTRTKSVQSCFALVVSVSCRRRSSKKSEGQFGPMTTGDVVGKLRKIL
jgi:hypothetical protein